MNWRKRTGRGFFTWNICYDRLAVKLVNYVRAICAMQGPTRICGRCTPNSMHCLLSVFIDFISSNPVKLEELQDVSFSDEVAVLSKQNNARVSSCFESYFSTSDQISFQQNLDLIRWRKKIKRWIMTEIMIRRMSKKIKLSRLFPSAVSNCDLGQALRGTERQDCWRSCHLIHGQDLTAGFLVRIPGQVQWERS